MTSPVLLSECRLEVLTIDRYLVLFLFFAERARNSVISRTGSVALLSAGCEATLGLDSVEEALGIETTLDKGSPDIRAKMAPRVDLNATAPLVRHLQIERIISIYAS